MAHPGGRPTKYDPSMCQLAIYHMSEGASKIEVMAALGLKSTTTFYEYVEKFPEFACAVKQGEVLSQAWWMSKGRQNIDTKEFNSTLWYMNMKNRFGWADKQEIKQDSNVKINVEINEALEFLESRKQSV